MCPAWLARNVTRSSDLDRVLALPRRTLTEADAEALVDEVTDVFITPLGRREGARLKPWQAAAIVEIANNRGAYLGMGVGCGKTLVFLLAALVLEARSEERRVGKECRSGRWTYDYK